MGNAVSEKLIDAINAHDVERIVDLAADDFELTDVATGETFRGKEGARRNIDGWFTPFPDLTCEIENLITSGEWEAIEAIGRGTQTGSITTPEGEIPPTGKKVEAKFVTISRIRDGKVVEQRDYYDLGTIMQQLGLMPEAMAATTG
jgi:steroid delta-isomerase-like uncharacterized protein